MWQPIKIEGLPKGTTHVSTLKCIVAPNGSLNISFNAFKYQNEVLMVYKTDSDNEYPGWRPAKDCFFHLNFPIYQVNQNVATN